MARRGGWKRIGSRGRFRYVDARGNPITDPETLERIASLAIPPAWRDVRISPRPGAKVQATGADAAGRRQYIYDPEFRAAQEQAKFDRLVLFGERLPELRAAMAEHMQLDGFDRERVSAVAVRLINLGWFRVGSERYARKSKAFGITTLRKSHVELRGTRITFRFRGKSRVWVRTFASISVRSSLRKTFAPGAGPWSLRLHSRSGVLRKPRARRRERLQQSCVLSATDSEIRPLSRERLTSVRRSWSNT